MKHLYRFLLVVICSIAWSYVKADHMAGMDLSFECVGQDSYKLRAIVYRDCTGIMRGGSISISARSLNCSSTETRTASLSVVSIADITPLCKKAQSACPNPPNGYHYANPNATVPYGTEEHVYEGLLVLTGTTCCKFTLSFTECCRSQGITTGAQWQNFTNTGIIDRCATPCNNSPQFRNKPILVLCVGTEYCLNQGLYEPDGDSIVYSLGQPMQDGTNQTTWNSGFSRIKPLSLKNKANLDLDSATGDMCFTPVAQEMSILRIKVEEYRKSGTTWAKISEVNRDVQIIVVNCPSNKNPTISGILSHTVCAGDQVCVTLKTNDGNPKDTTRITWNNGIPDGVWSDDNGQEKRATGQFCWTPGDDDVSDFPHTFVAIATDDACPVNGFTSRAVRIKVNPKPKATYTITKQKCGYIDLTSTPAETYLNPSYEWVLEGRSYPYQNMSYQFSKPGKHKVLFKISAGGCTRSYEDSVVMDSFVSVQTIPDTFVCRGQAIRLTSVTSNGKAPYRYKWNTGVTADTLTYLEVTPSASRFYKIEVTDQEQCTNKDSVWVQVVDLPIVELGPDQRICRGDSVNFSAYDTLSTAIAYLWSNGSVANNISVADSNTYWVKVIDSAGCFSIDTVHLFVNERTILSPHPAVYVCLGDTAKLIAPAADSYVWYEVGGTGSPISVNQRLNVRPLVDTRYAYQVHRTIGGVKCINYDTIDVRINPLPVISLNGLTAEGCISEDLIYLPGPAQFPTLDPKTISYNVEWVCRSRKDLVSNGVFDISKVRPSTVIQAFYITAIVVNSNGCRAQDSMLLRVNPLPVVSAGNDRTMCSNEPRFVLKGTPTFGNVRKWTGTGVSVDGAGNYYFDANVASGGTHQLIYEFEDVKGCVNWDTVIYTVINIPIVEAGNLNQFCIYDQDYDLHLKTDFSPLGGVWSGQGVSYDNVSKHYFFSPYQAGVSSGQGWTLYYTYTDNGCPAYDSLFVTVNPAPVIDIDPQGDTVLCKTGAPLQLDLVTSSVGNAIWSGQGITSPTGMSTTFDPSGLSAGIYKVGVEFNAMASGCKSVDTIVLIVQEPPVVQIDPNIAAVCKGRIFTLGISHMDNAPGIQWSTRVGGGAFSDVSSYTPDYVPSDLDKAEGKVVIYVKTTDPNNILVCQDAWDTLEIGIFPTPGADFTVDDPDGCMPHLASFQGITDIPGSSFTWNFGDPASGSENTATGQNVSHLYTQSGSYTVTLRVQSPDKCDSIIRYNNLIRVYQVPTAVFTPKPAYTTVVLPKISFLNKSRETGSAPVYEWDFGDGTNSQEANPVHFYRGDTATYRVTLRVTTEDGCVHDTDGMVQIGPDITVFIPNAFTPGNGGEGRLLLNNKFYITVDGITEFNMWVYDRWGQLLYESNDQQQGWDGNFRGEPAQEDVYVYQVKVRSFEGKEYKYHGTVTLLR